MDTKKQKFRPSARLLSTIGENLIKDNYAAIVEMVKNSYDADASNVSIVFEMKKEILNIDIIDDGIGMTRDIIINKWLVPSTNDKLIRKVSSKGRILQGEKGIGRFSTAILGEKLELSTVSFGEKSHLEINWADFNDTKFLDEITFDLETSFTNEKNGSHFNIKCSDTSKFWSEENIEYLIKELQKMITPVKQSEDKFEISITFKNFNVNKYNNSIINITPLPLFKYYNYRISGTIFNDGKSKIIFESRIDNKSTKEDVSRIIKIPKELNYCGNVEFDFRVFERDKESLISYYKNDEYISMSSDNLKLGEIKRLLDKICGISVYKNDFRIRPYGDEGYDWLELDKKRVQHPSYKIGFNQISGTVKIEAEEKSGLKEKSARDGIREDSHYYGLKFLIESVIGILEAKRNNLKSETTDKKNDDLEQVINASSLKEKLDIVIKEAGLEQNFINKIEKIVNDDVKEKQEKILELNQSIAKYEGQATLGKIMDLIMHEIRKPLMWFNTQPQTAERAFARYNVTQDLNDLEKIIRILETSKTEATLISEFFKKIDILATRSSSLKENFNIFEVINDVLNIFDDTLKKENINICITCDRNLCFYGWKRDIIIALSNIIENSIYWISNFDNKSRKIDIKVINEKNNIIFIISDTGEGFLEEYLEKNLMFKPGVSSKPNGTGIGLAITGNCVSRNGGTIEAYNDNFGACIKIELPKKENS